MDNTPQKIISSTLYANSLTVVARVLGFVTSILLARHLGKVQFGQLTLFFSVTGIFMGLTDFGLLPYMVREISGNRASARWQLNRIIILKVSLLAPAFALGLAAAAGLGLGVEARTVVVCSLCYGAVRAFAAVVDAGFISLENVKKTIFWEFMFAVLMLASVAALAAAGRLSMNSALLTYIAVITAVFLLSWRQLAGALAPMRLRIARPDWSVLKESVHFFLTSSAGMIYTQLDVIILSWLRGAAATGYYGVGKNIVSGMLFLVLNMARVLFPVFSRLHRESPEEYRAYADRIFWLIPLFLLPLVTGGALLSEKMVVLFYGAEYLQAAPTFACLLFGYALQFLNMFMVVLMQAAYRHREVARLNWAAVLLNVASVLLLAHYWGHFGAGLAWVLTGLFIFLALFRLAAREGLGFSVPDRFYKSAAAVLLMAAFLLAFRSWNVVALVCCGAAVYAAALLALKCFSEQEYRLVLSIFSKTGPIPPEDMHKIPDRL